MNPTQPQPQPQPPPLLPPTQQQQQQPPSQPHRPSSSCDRHPQENFTGFCPSCLCERLAVLDPNSTSSTSTSRKPPTSSAAAAALKAIFRPSAAARGNSRPPTSSFIPELRRTKSFSASKNEGFSGAFEPQRKSCDVRVRSTLYSLFNQDNERKISKNDGSRVAAGEVETRNLASSSSVVQVPVIESEEEENVVVLEEDEDEDEIRVLEEPEPEPAPEREREREPHNVVALGNVIEERVQEIVEEEPEAEPELVVGEEEFLKPMKEHIDLDSQAKKSSVRDFKEIAGSFWSAASVFSKKLQKWRQKQKMKKQRCRNGAVVGSATLLPVEKPIGRQFRETQSEIADYGFGRRSCDTDPRFSLDAGRMSFDDPRYSFEEPRASWDGYLAAARTIPRMPTMLSVVEDSPVVPVTRIDAQIPVEEPMNAINENEDETLPGGSAQTREYYSDSSSRRRKSLDRSSSIRKTAAAVVAEMDELKPVSSVTNSNAKVTPASAADYFHGQKMVLPDRDLRDSNSNSLRDDCSETFEVGFRDTASVIGNNGDRKGSKKSSRRWSKAWNIWGLIHRRGGGGGGNKDEDEDSRYSRGNGNGVERSYSESWQEFRGERNGDARGGGFNRKVLRSNSSVSWRNAQSIGGPFGNLRKNDVQANGHGRKARDEFVLERNRSARYSPNNMDNGLLRLYLTPTRGGRRNGSGKGRSNQAHSIARSVLRLY
ncbi:protein OCTOPUS-like isoform X1 [Gastrolobium bilobum]|uniref:protein OCTOPUS-like isoform X1 n=1 Tax=Gastrolobium bilobum TaxID=150636 RepID=UPI002AB1F110|nr:protein OCTOPUS-like isoform X1 [Gastrolobium bilobum]